MSQSKKVGILKKRCGGVLIEGGLAMKVNQRSPSRQTPWAAIAHVFAVSATNNAACTFEVVVFLVLIYVSMLESLSRKLKFAYITS